jgi:hypothetical protein
MSQSRLDRIVFFIWIFKAEKARIARELEEYQERAEMRNEC